MPKNALVIAALLLLSLSCASSTDLGSPRPTRVGDLKMFPTARTYDPPGTVYRVDNKGVRFHVMELQLPIRTGQEAFQVAEETSKWNASAFAKFLGAITADAKRNRTMTVTFKPGPGTREYTEDVAVDDALDRAFSTGTLKFRKGSKYYVIRETVAFNTIDFKVTRDTDTSAAADVDIDKLVDSVTAEAKVGAKVEAKGGSKRELVQTFTAPHRVLFLEDQIEAAGLGAAGSAVRRTPAPGVTWQRESATPR